MPTRIDRNADTHERHRRNWQRLSEGAATFGLIVDGVTIEIAAGPVLQVKNLGISTGKLAADSVTFAKMQNLATDRLMGRDTAGTGDPEQISVGGGIEFTGSAGIQTSAFTGDVTKTAGGTVLSLAASGFAEIMRRISLEI
jgi:hypothetical protein